LVELSLGVGSKPSRLTRRGELLARLIGHGFGQTTLMR